MADSTDITLTLTRDEALVLYEWLWRCDRETTYHFVDQAEQRAVWNVECLLERELSEQLRDDYAAIIAAARARLRDDES